MVSVPSGPDISSFHTAVLALHHGFDPGDLESSLVRFICNNMSPLASKIKAKFVRKSFQST